MNTQYAIRRVADGAWLRDGGEWTQALCLARLFLTQGAALTTAAASTGLRGSEYSVLPIRDGEIA